MRGSSVLRDVSPYLTVEALKTRLAGKITKRTEELWPQPVNQLQITLEHLKLFPTPALKQGDVLPPVYHFLYFLPHLSEAELSSDGGDPTFNAGGSFVRRMWAGGRFEWQTDNPLLLGQTVTERTTLDSASAKMTKAGKPMIVVSAKKEYSNEQGLSLTETRQWLFREAEQTRPQKVDPSQELQAQSVKSAEAGRRLGSLLASEVLLFRFSALTFNAHRIHYDKVHTVEAEGHPDVVVHAPLNVLLLANAYRQAQRKTGAPLRSMQYRAQSPVYANQPYGIHLPGQDQIQAVHENGRVIMNASMDT